MKDNNKNYIISIFVGLVIILVLFNYLANNVEYYELEGKIIGKEVYENNYFLIIENEEGNIKKEQVDIEQYYKSDQGEWITLDDYRFKLK
ncbi:MAG: hypothetical protein AABY22_20435 [Nanoarchaeota archaeon]